MKYFVLCWLIAFVNLAEPWTRCYSSQFLLDWGFVVFFSSYANNLLLKHLFLWLLFDSWSLLESVVIRLEVWPQMLLLNLSKSFKKRRNKKLPANMFDQLCNTKETAILLNFRSNIYEILNCLKIRNLTFWLQKPRALPGILLSCVSHEFQGSKFLLINEKFRFFCFLTRNIEL